MAWPPKTPELRPCWRPWIASIEPSFSEKNPWSAIQKQFGQNMFYMPWDLTKTPQYYQSILEHSDSVIFKHNFKNDPNVPEYSTCKILKVLDISDWGQNLYKSVKFPSNFTKKIAVFPSYNYWDYQQAWFWAFLIQNPTYCHTWLFYFDKDSSFKPDKLPSWFVIWWTNFGSETQILKSEVLPTYDLFRQSYTPKPLEKRFPALSLFHMFFSLPWVLGWKVNIETTSGSSIPVLTRTYSVKWWEKYKIPASISLI